MNLQDTFEVDNLRGAPKIVLETPSGLENTVRSIDEGIHEETETETDETQVINILYNIILRIKEFAGNQRKYQN
jgi:hypothetical protein